MNDLAVSSGVADRLADPGTPEVARVPGLSGCEMSVCPASFRRHGLAFEQHP